MGRAMNATGLGAGLQTQRIFRIKLALLLAIVGAVWALRLFLSPTTLAAEITAAALVAIVPAAAIAFWRRPPPRFLLLASLVCDLVALTAGIHLGGGADQTSGPILYSVIVLLGGLLVSEGAAAALTVAAIGLYDAMVAAEYFQWLPHRVDYRRPPDRQVATAVMVSVYLAVLGWMLAYVVRLVRRGQEDAHRLRIEALAALSHDLKNPLNAIYGYADFIVSEGDATSSERARRIRFLARKSSDLLLDVLDVSGGDTRPLRVREAIVRPVQLLQELREWFEDAAQDRGIALATDTSAAPRECVADASLLQRALANLLDNALRHVPAGGHIHVACEQRGDRLVWSVADDGEGIEQALIPQLFEAFVSGARPGVSAARTGLGLFIVKRVAQAHGGEVVVGSAPGKGSRFELSFPLRVPVPR